MSKNLLPKELENKYEKRNNYFDWWVIQKEEEQTVFYVMGKYVFNILGDLTPNQILEYMNLYEWIHSCGFEQGVKETQSKIRTALGL